ncbi:transposase [Paracoccus siganidrum]|uniref:transposase n=1 Tax=Paracoccus siganidrum TaxID=1276757 RepID=UPI0011C38262|nr:transposase [Paracoccus siganidrum]
MADTAFPRKGSHSVGIAPQYVLVLGKNTNSPIHHVSLTQAAGATADRFAIRG